MELRPDAYADWDQIATNCEDAHRSVPPFRLGAPLDAVTGRTRQAEDRHGSSMGQPGAEGRRDL